MKPFKMFLLERKSKVVFQFGRFNPPTKGHQQNIEYGKKYAKSNNADFILFTSQSHDSTKNPLDFETKVKYLEELMDVKVSKDKTLKNAFQILEQLGKHYSDVTFIVGEDREVEFRNQMIKYAKQWGIDKFEVINSGARTPGVSGTDMRNYVKLNQFEKFKENLPLNINDDTAKQLFDDVKKGLKIK